MDKKLIKQLGSIGFEYTSKDSICMQLKIGLNYIFALHHRTGGDIFFCYFEKEYIHNQEPIKNPTFPQILAAIKEHTGVDLKKKTKREEIDELKTKVASLEDAIKSTNRVLEELNISIKARGRICSQEYRDKREAAKDNQEARKLYEVGKNVFSKMPAPDMSDFKEMTDRMQAAFKEFIKQEAKEQEKKAFEVGDRVVVVGNYDDARDGEIGFVITTPSKYGEPEYYVEFDGMTTWVHKDNLEHAPAESPKEKAIIDVLENILYWDTCPEDYKTIIKKYIREQASKAEEQKEKALEFGAPLECLTNHDGLSIGEKVLFISLQKDGKFYEVLTKGSNFYCIAKCHFKPL
jgi:vacuolar-type H+-ATPase subunit I/STV1